jgi:hypothetical protein
MLIGLSVLPALQDRRPCSDCRSRARIPEEISRRSRAERRPARDRRLMDRVRIRVEFFFRSIGRQIAGRGQVNGPVGARGGSVDARHRPIDRISAAGGAGQISRRTRVVAARPASKFLSLITITRNGSRLRATRPWSKRRGTSARPDLNAQPTRHKSQVPDPKASARGSTRPRRGGRAQSDRGLRRRVRAGLAASPECARHRLDESRKAPGRSPARARALIHGEE